MFFRRIQKKDMKDHCLYILFLVAVLSFAACKKTEIKEPECGPDSIQALLPETKTCFTFGCRRERDLQHLHPDRRSRDVQSPVLGHLYRRNAG